MGKAPGLTLQASIVQDNVPVQVAPRLFVGSIHAAFNVDVLKEMRISHIVNLAGNYATFPDDFAYLSISIRDKEYANLLSCLPVALLFVEAALANGKEHDEEDRGVLIHCAGGRSRSPAVAAAYLMTRHNLTLDEALTRIRSARPVVSLNAGFEAQLRSLEKAQGDVFAAHQLMLQTKLTAIVHERDDGLLDTPSSSSSCSHKKHNARHRGRHHHHMPSTPKETGDSSFTHDAANAACDDRGMIHGMVPSGVSLSLPDHYGAKGQLFLPSLRSMGTLFGCRACGENLFCASSMIDQCASTDRHVHTNHEAERCLTATTTTIDTKTKRPLLAKLRLRPHSPGVKGAQQQQQQSTGATGASKSNPTTPRLAVLKSAKKPSNPMSPQQIQSLSPNELPKSGSSSDLSIHQHQHRSKDELCRANSGFWRTLTSFKSSSKRAVNEPDEEKKKKAVLSPKAIAIDLSTTENETTDGDATHDKFLKDNTQQWQRQLMQLELSWADRTKKKTTSKAFSAQFTALMTRDARTMALLGASDQWCVAPPPWLLRANLQDAKGTITCPNERCSTKLGEWQWEGTVCACGCGHVVLPAFALDKAALRTFGSVVDAPAVSGDSTSIVHHSAGDSVSSGFASHEPIALHLPTRK